MLAGVLLALVGLADVVRARTGTDAAPRRVLTTTVIVLLWAAVTTTAVLGLGLAVWSALVTVVLAALWVATTIPVRSGGTPGGRDRPLPWLRRSGSWPAVLLAVAVAVLLLWAPGPDAPGFVADWHRDAGPTFVGAVPLAAIVAGVGSALFLVDSANVVVAQALPPGLSSDARPDAAAAAEQTRRKRFGWRRTAKAPAADAAAAAAAAADSTVTLKGGRMIGPIERLLLAGFSLAGAFPVVAALIAAKGIVRFPEIRRETTGYQAEYFLIGSLVSWAMAFSAAGMCWLLALG
ncbi:MULTISPECIES: hypothetical protein [Curtobacterium]|jgi:hypothetical protein|uniref:hypothetical protein n=1 Tax=Curtobacterium TaxID=2034 RepID=UPI000697A161|nr:MULTISPECIES: hypothetical protein [Curtobacterium]MBT1620506.1 hypothetical protein [Curtobacterium flaccumfaciens pv. poinsettiae]MDQ0538427.1 hypothetical protein [Curtobacterium flaccumfaciens]TPG08903.1 hypothetical protein EAH85_00990 [Curtobacterium flaccumfaciens]